MHRNRHPHHGSRPRLGRPGAWTLLVLGGILLLTAVAATPPKAEPTSRQLGSYVLLSWNDLGMHCMNFTHRNFSVLPPYNNVYAQIIRRGTTSEGPEVVTSGFTIEYSIPGNTYSAGKTDFWDFEDQLFGVSLPDDIGLTGKGLTGVLDAHADHFTAEGVPITPFTDAAPTTEDPYQQALLVARDATGAEIAVSRPVLPVSTELRCVDSGCHASEQDILDEHPDDGGFDANDTPHLCAGCHASPALGTSGIPEAGYFSYRIHEKHAFIDNQTPGIDGCYRCHPGVHARCLRGTMGSDYGMECQDCHGTMHEMAESIDEGRVPWLQEPRCGDCHGTQYAEAPGTLYRLSRGHGGVMCSGCHNSPHAILPSSEPRDNANVLDLQGTAGTLSDCGVCHETIPSTGFGPHGMSTTDVESALLDTELRLRVAPNPVVDNARITIPPGAGSSGRIIVFDAAGRTVAVVQPEQGSDGGGFAEWNRRGRKGEPAPPGIYFMQWRNETRSASAKIVVTE